MHELLLTAVLCAAQEPATQAGVLFAEELPFALADARVVELGGPAGMEVLVVGRQGEVRSWNLPREGFAGGLRGEARLAQPTRSALALAQASGAVAAPDLYVLDDKGASRLPVLSDGTHGKDAKELSRRVRLSLRTGMPRFVPFAPDIDRDGLPELVAPRAGRLEIWKRPVSTGDEAPDYQRLAAVRVVASTSRRADAGLASDILEASLRVPSLRLLDQNGDGKDDIWVEEGEQRAWHIVGADGRIPEDPTRKLDLSTFRDSSSEGSTLAPGRVFAGGQTASLQARDLDGDGVVDFVVAHRRKVWSFLGTRQGPQFEQPAAILKSAEDATLILLAQLDEDQRPDLLVLRVVVPGVGTLIRGLVGEWEVEMDAVAYANAGGGQFGKEPSQRATIVFRLPPILDVVRDPEKILTRFETAGQSVRQPIEGDWDGDGRVDIAMLDGDVANGQTHVDAWLGAQGELKSESQDDERLLKKLLFEESGRPWDLDRAIEWLSNFGEGRVRDLTGAREPSATIQLPDAATWRVAIAQGADLDGDGRDELLLVRRAKGDSQRAQLLALRIAGG
ncbi:MAG: FG-GAP-like repeat [Planctomycetota bacterium]